MFSIFRAVTTAILVSYLLLVILTIQNEWVWDQVDSIVGIYRLAVMAVPLGGLQWLAWREEYQRAFTR